MQSETRKAARIATGQQNPYPSSTKLTESGKSLPTTFRRNKYGKKVTKVEEVEEIKDAA